MAFQRKSSKVLAEALERASNLRAIDPNLDLGNNLTLADYDAKIAHLQTSQDTYNGKLAQADAAGNDFRADEKDVRNMSSLMLSGVKVKYGRDSNEYEMAGGTRLSDRKKRSRKSESEPETGEQGNSQ